MNLNYEIACGCHRGRVRDNNEDNLYFAGIILPEEHTEMEPRTETISLLLEPGLRKGFSVAVFDGMGGEADGQIASCLAAQTYKKCIAEAMSAKTMNVFLEDAISRMNSVVAAIAKENYSRMGTTAVMMCFPGRRYYICNVGDSKAFLMRDTELSQISIDHTDILTLQRLGITDRKPRLSQYIGMYEDDMTVEPYISNGDVADGDQFLLCSDGLTDMVEQDMIEHIMQKARTSRDCVDELVAAALHRGGRDNITVIVVRAQLVSE